jgi:GLPGLI family protein
MDEGMKQMIMERMKKMLEKTYILTFTNDESIYKEEEVLETGGSGRGMAMMMGSFTPGVQYKNVKKNELIEEREFFGKQFLIVDSIPKLNWKLEKESKQIGQYIAFKATALKPVDSSDLSMMRRRRPEPDQEKKKDSIQKEEDPIDQIEVPKEILVTAWYTPQIPVSNGPGEYAGLPGLILELNVYRTTILCNKIVLNPKEVEEIKPPNKGKKVTRKEYNKIIGEKMKEMRENFRGRRGGRPMGGL